MRVSAVSFSRILRQPLSSTYLKGALPQRDLVSISHFFLDRLSLAEINILRQIAKGLDGREIYVGNTCSGLETGVMCADALWRAINTRFQTQVKVVGKFAVESDRDKQRFILAAHGQNIQHLFADVACFSETEAWCLKTEMMVPIPEVFLLIAGVACTDVSGENANRSKFANCYREATGASGQTYEYGYKRAITRCKASVSLYENVADAAHHLKDQNGVPQQPAVEVVAEDLHRAGHAFEYAKLCSSDFLLPQRRNRVWGSSCLGEDAETYGLRMLMTCQRMQSTNRFLLENMLEPNLPRVKLTSDTNRKHQQMIKKICRKKGLECERMTMDMQASESRGPEFAGPSLLTCCRPTHSIYHLGLERVVRGHEMLAAQGVFADSAFDCTGVKFLSCFGRAIKGGLLMAVRQGPF